VRASIASWRGILWLVLLLFSVAFLEACAPKNEGELTPVVSGPPNTSLPMPPLKGTESIGQMGWALIDGQRVTIASFVGKVLVLDFYATWCLPCRESIPHLVELQKRYGSQGLAIVGLNVGGPEDREAIPGFAREFKMQYFLGFPDQSLTDLLLSDRDAIPQTFVFDRQGHLIKRYIGYESSMAHELEGTIRAALTSR
jgi:thiol-disulfide isomerase/thioredoxin